MQDADYAFGRGHAEYKRLIEQAQIFRPLTERMLRNAGIGAGMHVLDIGCGAGDVSFLVSALVGAEGSVTGVDRDGDAIGAAEQRRAAQGITNISFRQADARSLDSGPVFDAAVGRFVLMFMPDPTSAPSCTHGCATPGSSPTPGRWRSSCSAPLAIPAPTAAGPCSPAACSPRSSSTTCARNCSPQPASSRCPGS